MTSRRVLAALALTGLLSTCAEPPAGPGAPGIASVGVRAVAPPDLSRFAPGLVVTQVKAELKRLNGDIFRVLDSKTVQLAADQNTVSVPFSLLVVSPETLYVTLDYQTATGTSLFLASEQVVVRPGVSVPGPVVQPVYIGPGSNIAFISITPFDSVLSAGDALTFDVQAFDGNQQPVTSFYVSWSTDDPRIPINALGQVTAPDLTKLLTVSVQTPNFVFASTTLGVLGSAALGLAPDSVEKLPSGTQQFNVTIGATRGATLIWSAGGVDGGNATVGTIDTTGFYTAPAAVPNGGKVVVCAREAAAPSRQGCAVVVITAVPTAGQDVIVFNDLNLLVDYAVPNARLIKNLVTFNTTGPRRTGKLVLHELSHNPRCLQPTVGCDAVLRTSLDSIIQQQGLTPVEQTTAPITTLPLQIRTVILWTPQQPYDTTEINVLKRFASEGGRIIFIGEREPYYGTFGIDSVENRFFREMGAQLTNIAADIALAAPYTVPAAGLRTHQVTTKVDSIQFSAASIVVPGPNDFAFVVDTAQGNAVLGAVAKIDVTPLPAPLLPIRTAALRPAIRPSPPYARASAGP